VGKSHATDALTEQREARVSPSPPLLSSLRSHDYVRPGSLKVTHPCRPRSHRGRPVAVTPTTGPNSDAAMAASKINTIPSRRSRCAG
jgi:hypothetical protein